MYADTSHSTRGGNTSTRHLRRASYRAHGPVLQRPMAHVSQGSEAESAAMRLALRHQEALEPLGTLQDALTLQHGVSFGAVGPGCQVARRVEIAQALGTTRAGTLALGPGLARVSKPGARLSAVRLAMAPAACAVLGLGPFEEDALYANLHWLASAPAAREDRLYGQRPTPKPLTRFVYDVTRSSLAGPHHALAAFGDNRAGTQGKRQRVLGLRCAADGPPVSIEVGPGHTPAPQTCAAQRTQGKA
jgi:hypothetical protein